VVSLLSVLPSSAIALAKADSLKKGAGLKKGQTAFVQASVINGKGRWQTGIEVLVAFHHYCLFNNEGTNTLQ
jgi:hypothetical protein